MNDQQESTIPKIVELLRKREYTYLKTLGSGACGITILLRDEDINELFVCKKYRPYDESERATLFANFIREVKLLHRLHHLNVVRVFSHFLYHSSFAGYLLMEFVDGQNIDKYVASHPDRIDDIFLQTLSGFAHLESVGILHRDIRPANIMVTHEGTVKIIDLGFGKQVTGEFDFDKSISLNWWCDTPEEFISKKYTFSTEVYFVGKLFEKLIHDNQITQFGQREVLRKMCNFQADARYESFSDTLRELHSSQFQEIEFSYEEKQAYRGFADAICWQVTKIEEGATYINDYGKICNLLMDAYQSVLLEEKLPDAAIVSRCLINGTYFYRKEGFSVLTLKRFVSLLRSCSGDKLTSLFANLFTRLNSIPRYAKPNQDDAPF